MIIKTDQDAIHNYTVDSSNIRDGRADKVAIPDNEAELSGFLRKANAAHMPVTVSGGGTGTTGSRIPFGGSVVSMERFNRITDVSVAGMSATAQAGVMVEELKSAADEVGLFYTSHPTEKTAFIGGTVSTNASGSRSYRYGPTRRFVKRLKMLLADGSSFEVSRGRRILTGKDPVVLLPSGRKAVVPIGAYEVPDVKSSAGYYIKDGMDLIDLFIGQEGTLSVITEIDMGLVKKPSGILSAFVFFTDEESCLLFTQEIKSRKDLALLSVEFFDHNAVDILRLKNANVPAAASSAIFFEQDLTGRDTDEAAKLWSEMTVRFNSSPAFTWVAMNEKDAAMFTQLRYSIPEHINDLVRKKGFRKFSCDIAVPSGRFMEMVDFYNNGIKKEGFSHVIFGHIGEDHLHVNILPDRAEELDRAGSLVKEFISKAVSLKGTVSAEHGIGKLKREYLKMMYGERAISEMAKLKAAFDPNCILNLDNIFGRENLTCNLPF